jgi:hypothetical protein
MLLNVPITAECSVNSLRLAVREIAFGDCYVRHPYEMELVLYRYFCCAVRCACFVVDTWGSGDLFTYLQCYWCYSLQYKWIRN